MSLEEDRLVPVDAPMVPGAGPLHRGRWAPISARAKGWLVCAVASAGLFVLGFVLLFVLLAVTGDDRTLLVPFACWVVSIILLVPAYRLGWHQRWDRHDDDACRYATGTAARLNGDHVGVALSVAGRRAGEPRASRHGRHRVLAVADRELTLQERVTTRSPTGTITGVEVRLADETDADTPDAATTVVLVRGDRCGGWVDWTLELGGGPLRLRQRLRAVPTRRTLLDRWGRAYAARGDVDAGSWTVDVPPGTTAVEAGALAWFLAHLDAIGIDRCYHRAAGDGPSRTTGDGDAPPERSTDGRWRTVGTRNDRPAAPTAEGGVDL